MQSINRRNAIVGAAGIAAAVATLRPAQADPFAVSPEISALLPEYRAHMDRRNAIGRKARHLPFGPECSALEDAAGEADSDACAVVDEMLHIRPQTWGDLTTQIETILDADYENVVDMEYCRRLLADIRRLAGIGGVS